MQAVGVLEEQMDKWSKSPSETEETKCQNTVKRITDALKKKFGENVEIYLQGSYRNRTNVRADSDVDIVVCYKNCYYPDLSNLSDADKAIYESLKILASYTVEQFKTDVASTLTAEFDYGEVVRKNKCIKVKKNSSRVDADVVACFQHKRFSTPTTVSAEGIEFRTDDAVAVVNFPKQHYDNGVLKNTSTGQMYKAVTRILKNVRNELIDSGKLTKEDMRSYFLECLIWNVLPQAHFIQQTYHEATKNVIRQSWNDMRNPLKTDSYVEVNGLKWLFKGTQRNPAQAEAFMLKAWQFLGY